MYSIKIADASAPVNAQVFAHMDHIFNSNFSELKISFSKLDPRHCKKKSSLMTGG